MQVVMDSFIFSKWESMKHECVATVSKNPLSYQSKLLLSFYQKYLLYEPLWPRDFNLIAFRYIGSSHVHHLIRERNKNVQSFNYHLEVLFSVEVPLTWQIDWFEMSAFGT